MRFLQPVYPNSSMMDCSSVAKKRITLSFLVTTFSREILSEIKIIRKFNVELDLFKITKKA